MLTQQYHCTFEHNAQQRLWEVLRNRQLEGCHFVRQVLIGPFIVDFVCLEQHLVVELDLTADHQQHQCDRRRTELLQHQGFAVVRFFYEEVLTDLTKVVVKLKGELTAKSDANAEHCTQ